MYRLIRFWSLRVLNLAMMFSTLIGAQAVSAQTPSVSICLRFMSDGVNPGQINLNNGTSVIPAQMPFSPGFEDAAFYHVPSPDGQHTVYIDFGGRVDRLERPLISIMLKPTDALASSALILESSIAAPFQLSAWDERDYAWSPNSQWLAYHWQSTSGVHYLSIVDRDGQNKRTVTLSAQPADEVDLYGWSPDSTYLALSTQPTQYDPMISDKPITVTLWSARDLKQVRSVAQPGIVPGRRFVGHMAPNPPDKIQWSTARDWLSVPILSNGQTLTLRLLAPDPAHDVSLVVPFIGINDGGYFDLQWSPDGRHIVLWSKFAAVQNTARVDILALDGTQMLDVLHEAVQNALDLTFENWSADSQTLFFTRRQASTDQSFADHYDLLALRLNQNAPIVLLPDYHVSSGMKIISDDRQYLLLDQLGYQTGVNHLRLFDTTSLKEIFNMDYSFGVGSDTFELETFNHGKGIAIYEGDHDAPIALVNAVTGAGIDLVSHYWGALDGGNSSPQLGLGNQFIYGISPDTHDFQYKRLPSDYWDSDFISPDNHLLVFYSELYPYGIGNNLKVATASGAPLYEYTVAIDPDSLHFAPCQ